MAEDQLGLPVTIAMPCGNQNTYYTIDDIPLVDVPCPCRDPTIGQLGGGAILNTDATMKQVEEWAGVTIGMSADAVLKLHPNTEWVEEKPTVRVDSRTIGRRIPDLIVTWRYDEADLVLERATVDDPMFGKITAYAVQKIILKGDQHGHKHERNGTRRKHEGQGRSRKKRQTHR